MGNNDILQTLKDRFSKPLNEFYKRRIIFWNDSEKEFESLIEGLEIENVKIVILNGHNSFAVKKEILEDNPNLNYLVYCPVRYEKEEDNWLLDIEIYSEQFRADYVSNLMDELNALDSFQMRSALKDYTVFFESNKRKQKFIELCPALVDLKNLHLGVIAVLTNSKSLSLSQILLNIYSTGYDSKYLEDISKFGNAEIFWKIITKYTGYTGNKLDELLYAILISALSQTMDSSTLKQFYPKYVNQDFSSMCYNIVCEWLSSTKDYKLVYEIIKNAGSELNIINMLDKLTIDEIADSDIFPHINGSLLNKIFAEINSNIIKSEENIEIVNKRRTMRFYDEYKNYFEGIYYASRIQGLYSKYQNIFHFLSSKELWKKYEEELYKFDYYYRKFHYYLSLSLAHTNVHVDDEFKKCADYIENLYKTWFLSNLSNNWFSVCKDELKEAGHCSGIKSQLSFYYDFVRNKSEEKITFVIISDALRYEVGKELSETLKKNDRATVDIKAYQSVFPSITPFGMSALLPGAKTIDENNNIFISGIKAEGIENRELILKKAKAESIAIRYEDFLNKKKEERTELIKGVKVVYIYHDEIDARGHVNEKQVFDACETTVEKLSNLVTILVNLRSSCHIVITSDHGFLYNYRSLKEADKTSKTDLDGVVLSGRRYVVGTETTQSDLLAEVKMEINNANNSLKGFSPLDVVRIKMPGGGENYVHGGALIQELMIPVITYENVRADSKNYLNNSEKYDTTIAKIQLLNDSRKISNLTFPLNFYQKDVVGDKVLPATYEIYMVDKVGHVISDSKTIIADKKDEDSSKRTTKVLINLKNQSYDSNEFYYLMIMNKDTQDIVERIEYQINILFGGDFDF